MNFSTVAKVFTDWDSVFRDLSDSPPPADQVFFRYSLWLGLIPPVCAYIGLTLFHGWDFGVEDVVFLEPPIALAISTIYFLLLLAGFFATAMLMRWLAPTYGADGSYHACFALASAVGTPMMLGGLCHLYPSVALNIAVFVPAGLWSAYLLYRGLPTVLRTGPEAGMLMSTAIVGVLLVALAASLSAVTILWVNGFGPKGIWV